jgi:hypothetical protein
MVPLSVVVATTQPWPEARGCLESLHDQVRERGGEIVLAHRGDGFDADAARTYPLVTPVVAPGRSANELRGIALEHVRGEIVAITEDHCVVAPDWCGRHLDAHRTHPHAAAVGGAVENGACDHAIDWAAFFLANASAMLPLDDGPAKSIAAQANVSYKRRFLPERAPEGGFFELDHNAQLRRRGEQLVVDSRIVTRHVQSLGFLGTCAIWFHASRTWGAHDGAGRNLGGRALRALRTPLLHPLAIVRHLGKVWAKGRMRGRIVQVAPLMLLLGACATTAVAIGYAAGAGDSARHIR